MFIEVLESRRLLSAASLLGGADTGALLGLGQQDTIVNNRAYSVHLVGANEVPARETRAQGQFIYRINSDGTEISYKLIVANIQNVVAAHIHLGLPTQNGGVVETLVSGLAPGGGRSSGVIASGTITEASLEGTLAGQPLSELIAAIQSGNAYVNVHTNDGVAPTNTGAGDFPGGEIRAQL